MSVKRKVVKLVNGVPTEHYGSVTDAAVANGQTPQFISKYLNGRAHNDAISYAYDDDLGVGRLPIREVEMLVDGVVTQTFKSAKEASEKAYYNLHYVERILRGGCKRNSVKGVTFRYKDERWRYTRDV